jgi:hypothetical protein
VNLQHAQLWPEWHAQASGTASMRERDASWPLRCERTMNLLYDAGLSSMSQA